MPYEWIEVSQKELDIQRLFNQQEEEIKRQHYLNNETYRQEYESLKDFLVTSHDWIVAIKCVLSKVKPYDRINAWLEFRRNYGDK